MEQKSLSLRLDFEISKFAIVQDRNKQKSGSKLYRHKSIRDNIQRDERCSYIRGDIFMN